MTNQTSRLLQAIAETETLLNKALTYSHEFQKPAQLAYYRAHMKHLECMLNGVESLPAVADISRWDELRCVAEAKAAQFKLE